MFVPVKIMGDKEVVHPCKDDVRPSGDKDIARMLDMNFDTQTTRNLFVPAKTAGPMGDKDVVRPFKLIFSPVATRTLFLPSK